MQQNSSSPKSLPIFPLLAAAFLGILLVVFSEFVFDNSKLMLNSDILNGLGSRYLRADSPVLPLWDDSRLGGLPTLDALFGDAYHPLVIMQFIMDPARAVGFKFLLTVWIAFMSAFTLTRFLTSSWKWGALLGFLYAFNPQYFTHIYGGHDGKMMVFAIAPFAAYALVRLLREGSLLYAFYLSLSLIWMILTSHLQLTYYFLWGAGLYTLYETAVLKIPMRSKGFRLGLAGLALASSLLATSFQILPPYLYTTQQSVRGTDEKTGIGHAASWSLHQEELAAMLIPGFIGVDVHAAEPGPNDNRYWGHNSFKLNADGAGALLTFLAFLGLFVPGERRNAAFWFLGSSVALSLALGAHSPLFTLWYNILPGAKSFRAPSMAIFWIPLAMLFMAAPVLNYFGSSDKRRLLPGMGLFGVLLVMVLVARFSWDLFLGPVGALITVAFGILVLAVLSVQETDQSVTPSRLGEALQKGLPTTSRLDQILILLPFVLVALVLNSGEKLLSVPETAPYFKSLDRNLMAQLSATILPGFLLVAGVFVSAWFILGSGLSKNQKALYLVLVASAELYFVNHSFIQTVPRAQYYQPEHPVLAAIRQDSPDSLQRPRILSLTRQPALKDNIFPAYGMRNAIGFHDNELASYRAFRGGQGSENYLVNPQDNAFLNLENVGYILYETPEGLRILKNSNAMGNATLYYNWQAMDSESAIRNLQNPAFDYKHTLLLDSMPNGVQPQASPAEGGVQLQSGSSMDRQLFKVKSSAPGMLMVSGNFHPYWRANVNGKPAPVYKAFGTLRATPIPAGESSVEMYYQSDAVSTCIPLVILGFSLVGLMGIAIVVGKVKKVQAKSNLAT